MQYIIGFSTLIRKEIARLTKIWAQALCPPIITTTLYFLIFGQMLGQHIPSIHGVDYKTFIAPGLVMMALILSAYNHVTASFFGERFQRSIEELEYAPLPIHYIMCGYLLGGILRSLIVGTIVMMVAFVFTDITIKHPLLLVATYLTSSIIFSLVGFINAGYAKRFDDIAIIPNFILTPLIYIGGVFVPVSQLPSPWQDIAFYNPILYLIGLFRYSCLGFSDVAHFQAIFVCLALSVGLYFWGVKLLKEA